MEVRALEFGLPAICKPSLVVCSVNIPNSCNILIVYAIGYRWSTISLMPGRKTFEYHRYYRSFGWKIMPFQVNMWYNVIKYLYSTSSQYLFRGLLSTDQMLNVLLWTNSFSQLSAVSWKSHQKQAHPHAWNQPQNPVDRFIHSFIQAISILPLQAHYYSEVLPIQHGYCVGATGNCEWRTCPRSLCGG